LVAAAGVFFRFKIPTIVGELSGRRANKQIKKIRESASQTARSPMTNISYKGRSQKLDNINSVASQKAKPLVTGKDLNTAAANTENPYSQGRAPSMCETQLLSAVDSDANMTTLLSPGTMVLGQSDIQRSIFTIVKSVLVVHTEERIK
jgi:hypothetical protein